MNAFFKIAFFALFIGSYLPGYSQEFETAIKERPVLKDARRNQKETRGRTVLSLPFFEDFTNTDYYPSADQWQDSMVYINNVLGRRIQSRGIATFDALNAKGLPYSPNSAFASVYADSLTSQLIDLSAHSPGDSVYLSFLFEGKGNGFAPQAADSLMLFFQRSNGSWAKVWEQKGAAMESFATALIPLTDTTLFHSDFRFRFVNKATFNVGNAHWHIDYLKMDTGRHYQDSINNDLAFSYWGNDDYNRSLLNEYMAMPYNHFDANRTVHYSGLLGMTLRNTWLTTQQANIVLQLNNSQTGANLITSPQQTFVPFNDRQGLDIAVPGTASVLTANGNEPFTIDAKAYWTQPVTGDYSAANDTITYRQTFSNYFAYDDGSAESAYYMSSYQGVPSFVAQEYALSVRDTLRGVQIYFPRQVPDAANKMFYLQIYRKIDVVDGQNEMVYEQTDLYPDYESRVNGFVTYRFDNPPVLDAGAFYVALMFPAGGFSDSLYIGLDKNKRGANFRYYKVATQWEPSLIDGALMIRPLVGKAIPVSVAAVGSSAMTIEVFPNPAGQYIKVKTGAEITGLKYTILDILGKELKAGTVHGAKIDLGTLAAGIYLINFRDAKGRLSQKKIIKH
ncbi:MAG: T9SS type A sorting domain-containing protein [Sphingobacteriales bacterium]|nr:MAG: T9SS type A sorting domain-containing protein [Sphingobacteriales bacterium]